MRECFGKKGISLLILLVFLSGCELTMPNEEKSYQLYYVNDYSAIGDVLISVTRYLTETQQEIQPLTLMRAHISYGNEVDVVSPFPSDLLVHRAEEEIHGVIDLYFSEEYADLTGIRRTVADYAVVRTLCQLSSVDGVRIFIQGHEEDSTPMILMEKDILLGTSSES